MNYLKNKKIIGCSVLAIIFLGVSLFLYGKNNNKVFKDKYMENIFVEEESEKVDNKSEKVDVSKEKDIKTSDLKKSKEKIVVEIKGEVSKPDVYSLEDGSIIKDLIDMAGGLTEEGDMSQINRADKLKNHQLIFVPNKNKIDDTTIDYNVSLPGKNESDSTLININTATIEELQKINGIGESKAKSIIDYRESNGGFNSIEDIKNVDGIGEKTYEKLKDKITS